MRLAKRAGAVLGGLLLTSVSMGGCTLISGVNDLEPTLDGGEADGAVEDSGAPGDASDDGAVDAGKDGASDAAEDGATPVTDATLALQGMSPHPTQIVDCAIVDAQDRLLARGLFRMPPDPGDGYPDVEMTLMGVLVGEAPFEVQFFADRNGNGVPDVPPDDHSWVRPLDDEGVMSFDHAFPLDDLTGETVQPIGDDLILRFAATADDPREAFGMQDAVYELRVSPPDGRSVAVVQLHPDPATILPGMIRVPGVVDAGNTFTLRVFADGVPVSGGELEVAAPASGGLEIQVTRALMGL